MRSTTGTVSTWAGRTQSWDRGPRISVHAFSRYLQDLPLDKVAVVNYTLKEIRFHTPSEHKIDGVTFPFEMQLIHGCSPETNTLCDKQDDDCPALFTRRAQVGARKP